MDIFLGRRVWSLGAYRVPQKNIDFIPITMNPPLHSVIKYYNYFTNERNRKNFLIFLTFYDCPRMFSKNFSRRHYT